MLSDEIIAKYKQAGKLSHDALQFGKTLIKPGVSMREILDKIEERIIKNGGGIAFPAQIAVNNIAAHYCPTLEDDYVFKEGDVAKLDLGVHIDGYVADNALTVDLGDHKELCQASKDGLDAALKIIKPGVTLGEIGRAIETAIKAKGFVPVKNLSGHGLGQFQIHTTPSVPNFDTKDDTPLEEGMVVAIEPFATNGAGAIFESTNPTIFSHVANKPTRSPYARQILSKIKQYEGLPFASRWLERELGVGKVRLGLSELVRNGSVITHAPLPEKGDGLVSQHEHSVIVANPPIVFTRDVE